MSASFLISSLRVARHTNNSRFPASQKEITFEITMHPGCPPAFAGVYTNTFALENTH